VEGASASEAHKGEVAGIVTCTRRASYDPLDKVRHLGGGGE
jgi:hypothetical protein